MSLLLKPASLHSCPEYGEEKAVSGKAGDGAKPVDVAFLKKKVFWFCGVGGKSHPCEFVCQQKAVQMRDGKRLPAGQQSGVSCLLPPH